MPRHPETVLLRAQVRGAGPVAAEFDQDARQVQDAIIREFRTIARHAEDVYRSFAPEDSGRLRESVDARVFLGNASTPQITVYARALDPTNNFDYLDVTRWGHRRTFIEPQRARMLKVHYAGRDRAGDGPYVLRPNVSGVVQPVDWVEEAEQVVEADFDAAASRLGRTIIRSV